MLNTEDHDLVGIYDLCAVEVEALDGVCESVLRAISLDLAELLCVSDSALCTEEALVEDSCACGAGVKIGSYKDLAACDRSEISTVECLAVVGKHELFLENSR